MNLYRKHSLIACLVLTGLPSLIASVSAATLIWDADGTSGGAVGGTGAWNTAGANFWDNAGAMQSWTGGSADTAVFGGTAGTVTLGAPITTGGLVFNSSGYTIAGGGNTLTLGGSNTIAGNYVTTTATTLNVALGGTNLVINPAVVNSTIANASQGQFALAASTAHTGTLSINGGAVVVNSGVSLASGSGITINGSGLYHPSGSHPYFGLRQGLLALNGTVDPIGSQMVTLNGGGILRSSIAGGSDTMTLQNVTASTGYNTFAAAPNGGAPSGDTLAITNLTRSNTATVEFRSTYGTLGGNADNGKVAITNLNGSAIANTNGILGGWAYANTVAAASNGNGPANAFATWDSALNSVKGATPDKASGSAAGAATSINQALSGALATDNWLANGANGNNTITANKTINSLIEQSDVIVNNGATLTLASGGYILRNANFWIQSATNDGKLTSGEANGKLYVNTAATIDAFGDQRIRLKITDNGATPVQLIKSGNGSVLVGTYGNGASTANSYTGGTIIQAGRLVASATNAFSSGTVQVLPGGQASLATAGTYANAFDISGAGAPETAGVLGAVRFSNGAIIGGGVTLSGDSRLHAHTAGETGTISGNITGNFGIEKTGAGTVILSGTTKSYTGSTLVNGGTLLATGSLATSAVTVNNTATLGAGNAAGNRATLGLSTLTANAGGSALFDLGGVTTVGGGVNDLFQISGALALPTSGTFGINVNPTSGVLANGAYTLMSFGSQTGGNVSNLALTGGAANTRQTLALDLTSSPGNLLLNVTGNGASLKYNNAGTNATWDLNTTANWDNGGANDKFYNGDAVTFEDTVSPAGPYTVTLTGALLPSGVTFNTAKDITLAGAGTIGGSGLLTKSGAGNLNVTGGHGFSGGTVINGGIVKMLAAGALGTGSITVNNGGALDHNGLTQAAGVAITIAGAGPDGLGALRSTGAGNGMINNLTLSGDATIGGGAGRWDIGSGAVALNGGTFTLTKVGSNSTWFRSLSSTTLGNLVINGGQFGVESGNNALGSTAYTATINTGGELSSWGGVSQNKPLVLNGGTLDTDWANGTSTWSGSVSVTADSFLKADAAGAIVNMTGDITGNGALTQTATTASDAVFQFSGNNSYSGATTINAGMLRAGSTTGLSSASAHTIAAAANLRLNGFNSSIGSLAGAGNVTNTSATSATLTVGADGTSTSFSGVIADGVGGGALSLTKTGAGSLTLSGVNTYSGVTTVSQGLLIVNGELTLSSVNLAGGTLSGSGKISAGATVNGTLAPGNSPGTLDFSGSDLTMGSASAAVFEIGGTNPATDIDRVVNIDSFTLDGIWTITLYNGFSPSLNDSFDLWDATSVDNSSFTTSTDLNLPALPGGLGWDSSAFAATGVLTVIPEPGTTALGALTALTLLRRRRRC